MKWESKDILYESLSQGQVETDLWFPYFAGHLATLESFKIVEQFGNSAVILHNLHKRVWPTAQRDSLFFSQLRSLGGNKYDGS